MIRNQASATTDTRPISTLPVRRRIELRAVVLAVAALLFAGIFVWRQLNGDGANGIAVLYIVPVALLALELGLLGGLAAAAFAIGLFGVWLLSGGEDLGLLGVSTRAVAIIAVGLAGGHFSNRMRHSQLRQQVLLGSGLSLADLAAEEEVSAALEREARTLVPTHGVRVELGERAVEYGTMREPQEVLPIEARGARYGTLTLSPLRPLQPEDRAALEVLVLQAAVATENQRLLQDERERAVMRTELRDARMRLVQRGRQLEELLANQEDERSHVAHELHEQAAQTLAAVLLGLGALERKLGSEQAGQTLGALRSDVDSTLRSLRSLAVSLRPPTLALGLQVALEQLAANVPGRGIGEMTVDLEGVERLDPDVETMVYRVVEEALGAVGLAHAVRVRGEAGASELVIAVEGGSRPIKPGPLAVLSARLELVRGTLTTSPTELRAEIPLHTSGGTVGVIDLHAARRRRAS